MGDLSKYFSRHEIACKCGCGFDTMDAETLMVANAAREFINAPVTPNSGCRCLAYNRKIGGKERSQHVLARAIDLPYRHPLDLFNWLCAMYSGVYGFGRYPWGVHIDTKTGPARRWVG